MSLYTVSGIFLVLLTLDLSDSQYMRSKLEID